MTIKLPVPKIPHVIKNEHLHAAAAARVAFRLDRADCPICEAGSLQPTGNDEARCCDHCGTVVTLDDLAIFNGERLDETAAQRHDYFRRNARLLMQIAALWLVIVAALSAYTGSAQMLIAAALLAVPVFAGVFAMRYRAWQAMTGRVYEAEAPFLDFLQFEVRGVIRQR